MICPYCGKVAYWYEIKTKGKKPETHACCEKAKQEEIREGIKMMDEFWATDGRSRQVAKHTDLDDDTVMKNWQSAEVWLNRYKERISKSLTAFLRDECSPTYDGRYTFSDAGIMAGKILSYLHSQDVVIKIIQPYPLKPLYKYELLI